MKFAKMGSKSIEVLWRLEEWFPDLSKEQKIFFKKYHEELLRFNNTVNLIGVGTIPNCDLVHFADSILASRVILGSENIENIYDFGSGNGFPGLIFAMLAPKTRVNVVESDQRKVEFLKHICSIFNLENVKVLNKRVEELPRESVDFAMSRGFASISKSLLAARKILKTGGIYFHLKAEEWAAEVGNIPIQLCSLWTIDLLKSYTLPIGGINFSIVRTKKIKN